MPHADIVLFCLPVNPHHEVVQQIAPLMKKTCLCVSNAKGLDETGKTAAQIFSENLAMHQSYALWPHDFRRNPGGSLCFWPIGLP
ncbi:hypothetical protein [Nitrosomonas sp. Nm166]|uniref:hypothetical protein n=1 Tax=Nitrosomonas sp. Nm166 TaxID=1881054 RepID=UPI000A77B3AA